MQRLAYKEALSCATQQCRMLRQLRKMERTITKLKTMIFLSLKSQSYRAWIPGGGGVSVESIRYLLKLVHSEENIYRSLESNSDLNGSIYIYEPSVADR